MISLSPLSQIGKMEDVNAVVECSMIANTVIAPGVTLKIRGQKMTRDSVVNKKEDELLATLTIKCKECDARMSSGRQEGKRYYLCDNNTGHADNLDRFVWVNMPEYLDWELDPKLSSQKEDD
jgi:hypothetical protein